MHESDSSDNPTVKAQAQGVGSPRPTHRPTRATACSGTRYSRSTVEQIGKKPELLVGKKIRHRFEVGEELVWFIGTVLSVDLETNEFEVSYEMFVISHSWMTLCVVTWNYCKFVIL